jgi:hypothetical protein
MYYKENTLMFSASNNCLKWAVIGQQYKPELQLLTTPTEYINIQLEYNI